MLLLGAVIIVVVVMSVVVFPSSRFLVSGGSRASWTSQPQKSAILSPQPGGKPRKFIRTCGGIGGEKKTLLFPQPGSSNPSEN